MTSVAHHHAGHSNLESQTTPQGGPIIPALEKDMMGLIYLISNEQCVCTVCAPVQKMIDAGVAPKPAKASSATPTATPSATVVAPPNGKPCGAEELALQRAAAGCDVIKVSFLSYLGCMPGLSACCHVASAMQSVRQT